jgi:4a-hydroxytetrahydrobiopterin dehydratase
MKPIVLDYIFENFQECLVFVNKVWVIAEKLNHHPNIIIKNYNQVTFEIFTHSSKSITKKDLELKKCICDLEW